jgi:hypothetical protein
MKLAELQAMFQEGVLAGEDAGAAVLKAIKPSASEDRETLFAVYVNAYRLRLREFMTEDYRSLRALLGADAFDALADDYIEAHTSRCRNARWYSSHLPDFMRSHEKWRSDKRAISVADFERALTDAFDAPDVDALAIDALALFSSERWPKLTFTFHPSLILLELLQGTVETYESLNEEKPRDIAAVLPGVEAVAVWRSVHDPVYRLLEDDEFLALNEARAGRAFGDICQMAAFQQGDALTPERLAQFLVSWFEEGLVVTVRDVEADESGPADQFSNTPSKA